MVLNVCHIALVALLVPLHVFNEVQVAKVAVPVQEALLKRKLMSYSQGQELGQLAFSLLLIGCSLLCSQSGASLLDDPTLDNDFNS